MLYCRHAGRTTSLSAKRKKESDPAKIDTIAKFPKPTNITEMRSFFGLVNQLGDFSPDIATAASSLRSLLRPSESFLWSPDHDNAFEEVKRLLTAPPVLAHFDPLADTELKTDASKKHGVGYGFTQIQQGVRRLIQCGSRFLTDTESRYSATEIELCAVKWAMKKCRLQLLGSPKPFKLVVDHQALVTILDKQTLDAVQNPRLQGMKERLMRFNFTTVWNKSKTHAIPNALSRSPVSNPSADDVDDHLACIHQVRASVHGTVAELSATGDPAGTSAGLSDPLLTALSVAGSADHDYMALLQTVQHGFPPTIGKTPTAVRPYWKIRQDLSHHDGLVLKGTRIVIPNFQRSHILTRLHASHQGTRRTLARERQLVYCHRLRSLPGSFPEQSRRTVDGRRSSCISFPGRLYGYLRPRRQPGIC